MLISIIFFLLKKLANISLETAFGNKRSIALLIAEANRKREYYKRNLCESVTRDSTIFYFNFNERRMQRF